MTELSSKVIFIDKRKTSMRLTSFPNTMNSQNNSYRPKQYNTI